MSDPTGIFISYRRSDTHWAAISLRHSLERAFPSAKLFYDGDSLKAGVKWPDRLRQGLADCGVLLALIGTRWATERDEKDIRRRLDIEEDWVRNEIAYALEHGKEVIPILIDEAALPSDATDLPRCLRSLLDCQATAFRRSDDKADLEKLTARLRELLPEAASATPPAPPNPQPRPAPAPPGTIAIDAAADLIAEAAADEATLGAIAFAQFEAGRYAMSEALFRRAHAALQEKRGAEDKQTLTARALHASAILGQGRAAEAEALMRDLLPLEETVRGPEHPETLTTRAEIARAALGQGRAAEAAKMWRDLLPFLEKVSGPEHPHTLTARANLTRAALDQGRAEEAETLLRDLLPLEEKVKGPEHPDTLITRRLIAWAVLQQGAADRARELLDALPDDADPNPQAKARAAMLRGWLADLDGDAGTATVLLDQADALLSDLTPEHPMRRNLTKYQETRVPGGAGGTMLWAQDRDE